MCACACACTNFKKTLQKNTAGSASRTVGTAAHNLNLRPPSPSSKKHFRQRQPHRRHHSHKLDLRPPTVSPSNAKVPKNESAGASRGSPAPGTRDAGCMVREQ